MVTSELFKIWHKKVSTLYNKTVLLDYSNSFLRELKKYYYFRRVVTGYMFNVAKDTKKRKQQSRKPFATFGASSCGSLKEAVLLRKKNLD